MKKQVQPTPTAIYYDYIYWIDKTEMDIGQKDCHLPTDPSRGHSRVLVLVVRPVYVSPEHPAKVGRHHPLVQVFDVEPRRDLAATVAGEHRQDLLVWKQGHLRRCENVVVRGFALYDCYFALYLCYFSKWNVISGCIPRV